MSLLRFNKLEDARSPYTEESGFEDYSEVSDASEDFYG
jgi:hypothetical protein